MRNEKERCSCDSLEWFEKKMVNRRKERLEKDQALWKRIKELMDKLPPK